MLEVGDLYRQQLRVHAWRPCWSGWGIFISTGPGQWGLGSMWGPGTSGWWDIGGEDYRGEGGGEPVGPSREGQGLDFWGSVGRLCVGWQVEKVCGGGWGLTSQCWHRPHVALSCSPGLLWKLLADYLSTYHGRFIIDRCDAYWKWQYELIFPGLTYAQCDKPLMPLAHNPFETMQRILNYFGRILCQEGNMQWTVRQLIKTHRQLMDTA